MKVKELIKRLEEFPEDREVVFAQANGDINMWCERISIQIEPGTENGGPVEIILVQEW